MKKPKQIRSNQLICFLRILIEVVLFPSLSNLNNSKIDYFQYQFYICHSCIGMLPKPIFPQLTQIIEYNKSTFCKFVYNSLQHLDTCNDNFFYFLSIVLFAIMWFHDIELFFVSFFVPLRFVENIFVFILMHPYQNFSIIIFVHLIYHIFCLIYVLCPPSHVTFDDTILNQRIILFAFFIS